MNKNPNAGTEAFDHDGLAEFSYSFLFIPIEYDALVWLPFALFLG